LKNQRLTYSNNTGFAGSLSFWNDLSPSRRRKREEIGTMQTVRENRKWNVRPPSDWNCQQRNHWWVLYQNRKVGGAEDISFANCSFV